MRKGQKIVFVLLLVGKSLLVSIIVVKYIFPHADKGHSCEKNVLTKPFAHAISEHYRDFEHVYVYRIDCAALLAML